MTSINDHDCSSKIGNVNFRTVIQQHCREYVYPYDHLPTGVSIENESSAMRYSMLQSVQKDVVAKAIRCAEDKGGRFCRRCPDDGRWYELSTKESTHKVKQALRDFEKSTNSADSTKIKAKRKLQQYKRRQEKKVHMEQVDITSATARHRASLTVVSLSTAVSEDDSSIDSSTSLLQEMKRQKMLQHFHMQKKRAYKARSLKLKQQRNAVTVNMQQPKPTMRHRLKKAPAVKTSRLDQLLNKSFPVSTSRLDQLLNKSFPMSTATASLMTRQRAAAATRPAVCTLSSRMNSTPSSDMFDISQQRALWLYQQRKMRAWQQEKQFLQQNDFSIRRQQHEAAIFRYF